MIRAILSGFKSAILLMASITTILGVTTSISAQMRDVDRRLNVAVVGFELNEAAAKDALADGANINARNEAMNGETMLITAIKGFKEPKVIKFLLDNGAEPSIKDESGRTALSYARQYNIGKNQAGREIIKMLEDATQKPAGTGAGASKQVPGENNRANNSTVDAPLKSENGRTEPATTRRKPRKGNGPLTAEDVQAVLEESLTAEYQNHAYGVKNKVTFEWAGPITIGAAELRPQARGRCYPVKLRVKVTAVDPRDGKTSTVERGIQANIGGYLKKEIFCFFRNGFGEWEYGTYYL